LKVKDTVHEMTIEECEKLRDELIRAFPVENKISIPAAPVETRQWSTNKPKKKSSGSIPWEREGDTFVKGSMRIPLVSVDKVYNVMSTTEFMNMNVLATKTELSTAYISSICQILVGMNLAVLQRGGLSGGYSFRKKVLSNQNKTPLEAPASTAADLTGLVKGRQREIDAYRNK